MANRPDGSSASMDKISELPQVLLQHIQYYLSPKQAAQTVILSKAWRNTWSSSNSPNFNLDEYSFRGTDHDEFLSRVHNTLQGYHDNKLRINAFKLGLLKLVSESVLLLEKWIPIVIRMGVKTFHLNIYHDLPRAVFEAESFVELSLNRCWLDHQTLVHDKEIMFKHLKVLKLSYVYIERITFQRIISSCPLIEYMKLVKCKGLRSIKVNDLPNLKEFYFEYYYDYLHIRDHCIEIGVSFTNLKSISIHYYANWFHVHKFRGFPNLKYLSLTEVCLSGISLYDFSCYFPSLENLEFTDCYGFEEIQILSDSIQHISLKGIHRSIMARIDAPNIRYFEFSGSFIPTLSIARTSSKWRSDVILYFEVDLSLIWLNLIEMLTELSQSEISLDFSKHADYDQQNNIVVHLKPVEVEYVILSSPQHSSGVNGLFFVCRPRNVDVYWYANAKYEWERERESNEFAEYVCKILMERAESTGNQEFTWQKDLKEVSLNVFDDDLDEWRPLHETSLRNCALRDDEYQQQIRFQLKWREAVNLLNDQCEP